MLAVVASGCAWTEKSNQDDGKALKLEWSDGCKAL
jgi:hypothetical protein